MDRERSDRASGVLAARESPQRREPVAVPVCGPHREVTKRRGERCARDLLVRRDEARPAPVAARSRAAREVRLQQPWLSLIETPKQRDPYDSRVILR